MSDPLLSDELAMLDVGETRRFGDVAVRRTALRFLITDAAQPSWASGAWLARTSRAATRLVEQRQEAIEVRRGTR